MFPLPVFNKASRDSNLGPPASFTKRAGNQPSLLFDAMSGTIALGRGGVAPTFTRATVATVTDQDLVVRQVLSGEARFGGFRRTQNYCVSSESTAEATYSGTTAPTNGGLLSVNGDTYRGVTFTSGVAGYAASRAFFAGSVTTGYPAITNAVTKYQARIKLFLSRALTGTEEIKVYVVNLAAGAGGAKFIRFAAEYCPTSPVALGIDNDTDGATNATPQQGWLVVPNVALTSPCTVYAKYFYIEPLIVTSTNHTRSEYISSAVVSAPYFGANVDAVKYYRYNQSNYCVLIGDSLTANGLLTFGYYGVHAQQITDTLSVEFKGVPGETLVQIQTRFATDVVALSPKTCLIFGGVNDITGAGADPNATMQTAVTTMVASAQGAGIAPMLATVIPAATSAGWTASMTTWANTFNTWIRAYAVTNNFPLLDARTVLEDPANPGTLLSAYDSGDGKHPNYAGQLALGNAFALIVPSAPPVSISSSILGGYLPEPAATDLLTARADARDMTTANWTLGVTMTRARTSTGADGVASKANRLTGGAVAATNIITTTITAAASSRTYSVLIKRVTGTGPVRITQDNFATSTDISSLINSSTFTLVQINQSQLNAVLGIKIDTNGDAIDADWNQFSAGDLTGLINSRIPDTITTRNADVLTYATTGWLNAAAGTLYAEWFNPNNSGTYIPAAINDSTVNNNIRVFVSTITTATADVAQGGGFVSQLSAVALTSAAVAKVVNAYQVNDFAGFGNNTSLGTDALGAIPTVNLLQVGCQFTANQLGHYIRKVSYYPTRMTNESAKALTV